MKNTLSKTLICGIIASSFILVNCQKAPTGRGVKGTAGKPVATADKVADEAVMAVVVAKCSPEFVKEYESWFENFKSYEAKKLKNVTSKDDLNEDQKVELKDLAKKFEETNSSVKLEIKKLQAAQDKIATEKKQDKKNLDGCYLKETTKNEYAFQNIEMHTNKALAKIRDLTGLDSAGAALHDKVVELRSAHSDVTKNAKFYVSEELNKSLDSADMDEVYFKSGKVLTGEEEKKKAIAAATVSVCYINKSGGKLENLDITLDSLETEKVAQVGSKTRFKVIMMSGDKDYVILCDLPEKKILSAGFRDAMGSLLQSKEQREKAKVKETKKAEAETAVVEKVKIKAIEKAEKENKKSPTEAELEAAVKKATVEVLKTKKVKPDISREKEIEDVTKADADAAEKARQQEEEEKIKAMDEESGT